MSFEIKINGHSNAPHNAAVQAAAVAAAAELEKVEGLTGMVTGYSWDNTERVDLAHMIPSTAAGYPSNTEPSADDAEVKADTEAATDGA
jgi:hypothetical protein